MLNILYAIFPLIFAITVHEAAHGRAALWCGDSTAKALGRITLNPIKHIDPIGTIVVPLVLILLSKTTSGAVPIFGWAKPVPVDVGSLRNPLRDQFWVSAAGPAANLIMAIGWLILLSVCWNLFNGQQTDSSIIQTIMIISQFGIFINVALMVINLIPILPLDGGRILMSLLPRRFAWKFSLTERYGLFIVLFLIFTHSIDFLFYGAFNIVGKVIMLFT